MKFTITKPIELERVISYLSKIDLLKQWSVSVSLIKSKRSIDQNSLYWLWLAAIESETGNSKEDLHEYFKDKYLGYKVNNVFDSEVKTRISTTKINTKEFTDYLEKIHLFVLEEIGVNLPYPDDRFFEQFLNEFKL
jgi:hypothetical protein